jgi:hypothetical protein
MDMFVIRLIKGLRGLLNPGYRLGHLGAQSRKSFNPMNQGSDGVHIG